MIIKSVVPAKSRLLLLVGLVCFKPGLGCPGPSQQLFTLQ